MRKSKFSDCLGILSGLFVMTCSLHAAADVVTDWNQRAGDIVVNANIGPLPADRALAIVQTAVYEAVNAITQRYSVHDVKIEAAPESSIHAAVAAVNRIVLKELVPNQSAEIEKAYQTALTTIQGGATKEAGVRTGEMAAHAILQLRRDDGASGSESYRPFTQAGRYVPTVIPEAPQWRYRKPWLMASPEQFRPIPPPDLSSDIWVRDFDEVKALGHKNSQQRTKEQTEIARFWEEVMPPIYHGIVRSVAAMPGREVTQNARLFAAVTQASDDALIAVFDAKYYYGFWRPVTAIRNADIDGNEATERDASWIPFIDTPMHPEYPCAHCIISAVVGTILQAELGQELPPLLTTSSKAAGGVTRNWGKLEDFMQEVAVARIYDGVHYRNSGEIGSKMGQKIAQLAAKKYQLDRH